MVRGGGPQRYPSLAHCGLTTEGALNGGELRAPFMWRASGHPCLSFRMTDAVSHDVTLLPADCNGGGGAVLPQFLLLLWCKCSPQAPASEHVFPSWCSCLGRLRALRKAESSLEVDL